MSKRSFVEHTFSFLDTSLATAFRLSLFVALTAPNRVILSPLCSPWLDGSVNDLVVYIEEKKMAYS
jgi:hypothetical protein